MKILLKSKVTGINLEDIVLGGMSPDPQRAGSYDSSGVRYQVISSLR